LGGLSFGGLGKRVSDSRLWTYQDYLGWKRACVARNEETAMKVAVIGGTGRAGSQIVQELARRGHQVTAIARNPDKAPKVAGVTAKAVDVHDAQAMTAALKGHDVIVSALRFLDAAPAEVIAVVKASGVPRYLIVGGASSLLAGGQRLFDSPHFPAEYKPEAGAGIDFLDALKAEPDHLPRLRHRHGRRDRDAQAPPQAVHGRLLSGSRKSGNRFSSTRSNSEYQFSTYCRRAASRRRNQESRQARLPQACNSAKAMDCS
jgi:hypothetical protein